MPKPKNNAEVQLKLKQIEAEIKTAIVASFPMMAVHTLGEYDIDDEGSYVGYFLEGQTQNLYSFFISKENENPILQKVSAKK